MLLRQAMYFEHPLSISYNQSMSGGGGTLDPWEKEKRSLGRWSQTCRSQLEWSPWPCWSSSYLMRLALSVPIPCQLQHSSSQQQCPSAAFLFSLQEFKATLPLFRSEVHSGATILQTVFQKYKMELTSESTYWRLGAKPASCFWWSKILPVRAIPPRGYFRFLIPALSAWKCPISISLLHSIQNVYTTQIHLQQPLFSVPHKKLPGEESRGLKF